MLFVVWSGDIDRASE